QDRLESPWPEGVAPDLRARQLTHAQRPFAGGGKSPDGKWVAFVKDDNVFVKDREGKETQLSKDGKAGNAYSLLSWSRDSKALVAFRVEPGERKEVNRIESSPKGGGRAKLHTQTYALPGDRFTAYELSVFDVASGKQVKPEVERVDFGYPQILW